MSKSERKEDWTEFCKPVEVCAANAELAQTSSKENRLPIVSLANVHMSIPVFFDSGCTYSIVSKSLAKKFTKKLHQCNSFELTCINGEKLKSKSYIILNIKLGHRSFTHKFYVLDRLPFPVFVGKDLIRLSDIVIHERGDSFWFHSEPDKKYSLAPMNGKYVFMLNADASQQKTMDEEIQKLLNRFPEVVPKTDEYGKTNLITHKINLNCDTPVKVRPMYYPPNFTMEIRRKIQQLLYEGRIRPSNSPYSANVVLAPKKDGKLRMTVSYKKLNALTIDDAIPIHKGQQILKNLPHGGYYSKIDLKSGFWQIGMHEEDIPKTAFQFDGQLYEFLVMPFGLKNSTATFVRLMNKVLEGTIGNYTYVYVDDIIIFSRSFEEHLTHLYDVLVRLKRAGLTINLSKCTFAKTELDFLGHRVTSQGIAMQAEKIKAITQWPTPKSKGDLHRFIGTCGWYREFIKDYATLTEPLSRLLGKKQTFQWTKSHQVIFDTLKKKLCEGTMLHTIDYDAPLYIKTDASNVGMGAILCQEIDGTERVISFASKLLDPAQRKLHACEKELLAVMWAVTKFKDYIWGENFTIITDNNALTYLNRFKETDTKLGRWAMRMEPYADRIIYRPGRENVVADALSRAPIDSDPQMNLDEDPDEMFIPAFSLTYDTPQLDEIRVLQDEDAAIAAIKKTLMAIKGHADESFILDDGIVYRKVEVPIMDESSGKLKNPLLDVLTQSGEPNGSSLGPSRSVRTHGQGSHASLDESQGLNAKVDISRSSHAEVKNNDDANVLQVKEAITDACNPSKLSTRRHRKYHVKKVIYLPDVMKQKVLKVFHDAPEAGHMGIRKTINRIVNRVYWPQMRTDIKNYVKSCHVCQTVKYDNVKPAGPMGKTDPAEDVFHTVFIDFVGPLPRSKSGNQHLLVLQDELSKWVELFPMRTATAKNVAKRLENEVFCRFGVPDTIVSDHGSQFESKLLKKLCKEWKIRHAFTSVYHPSPNQAERTNKTLIQMIRAYVKDNHRSWDENLPKIALAMRTMVHDSTKVTPSLLNLGREIKMPWDRRLASKQHTQVDAETTAENISSELKNIIQFVRENIQRAQDNYKKHYDKKRSNPDYKKGDQILLRNRLLSSKEDAVMKKLAPKWIGPYVVDQQVTPITYKIRNRQKKLIGIHHVSNMKKYVQRESEEETKEEHKTLPRRSNRTHHLPGIYKLLNTGKL